MSDEAPKCVRCGRPVEVHRAQFELFEQMHWLCFHLEFEHRADPDAPCDDPSCPWWLLDVYRNHLAALGVDPDSVVRDAVTRRYT
jgi:hypothetical protein